MYDEKEEVMLSELIKDRILRHTENTTLGLHIKSVTHASGSHYIIKCKYLSLKEEKGMSWSASEDSFLMPLERIISEFAVLENPKAIRSFSDGNWVTLTDLQKLADKNGKEII